MVLLLFDKWFSLIKLLQNLSALSCLSGIEMYDSE